MRGRGFGGDEVRECQKGAGRGQRGGGRMCRGVAVYGPPGGGGGFSPWRWPSTWHALAGEHMLTSEDHRLAVVHIDSTAHTSTKEFYGLRHILEIGCRGQYAPESGRITALESDRITAPRGLRGRHVNIATSVPPNRAPQTLHTHVEEAATHTMPNRNKGKYEKRAQRDEQATVAKRKEKRKR